MNTPSILLLGGLLFVIPFQARSQENTIALGRVSTAGDIQGSVNPIGATISATRPSPGRYEITVGAPGAFSGDGVGDFVVQAMVRTVGLTDRACATEVSSVDPDSLVATVYISDMEDNADLDEPDPSNLSFQFVIHRLRSGGSVSPNSRYLFATGSVTNTGALKLGLAANGATVTASNLADGDYRVRFEKIGAFGGLGLGDFVIVASSGSSSSFSDNIVAGAPNSINADHLELTFRSADVQNASNVNAVAEDEEFHFLVYRMTESESTGKAGSRLVLGMASVQGDNGILRRGATSIPGTFLTSERSGTGRYSVVLNAPGRFSGKSVDDFIILSHINAPDFSDRSVIAEPFLISPDSLTVAVRTNDLEVNGQLVAVAADSDFFLTIHDANASNRPDLLTGKSPSLTKMRGDNRYNTSGAGQKLRLRSSGAGKIRYHVASQNDGNVLQTLRFRGKIGAGHRKTRCYRISGGKVNVTATFRTTGDLVEDLRPADAARYRIESTLLADSTKSRTTVRCSTNSPAAPGVLDATKADILRKP